MLDSSKILVLMLMSLEFYNIEAKISMLAVLVRESCRDLLCVYGKALNQKKIYFPYMEPDDSG